MFPKRFIHDDQTGGPPGGDGSEQQEQGENPTFHGSLDRKPRQMLPRFFRWGITGHFTIRSGKSEFYDSLAGLPAERNKGKDVPMKIDEIRNLRDAVQFQPFALRLADGRAIPVRHRDFLMTSPSGRTVIVYQPDDSFDVVDVMLITSLRVKSLNGRSRRRRQ